MPWGPEPPTVGQPRARAWLAAARRSPGHAYLFVGPHGTGKRTAMHWLAAAWQCEQEDKAPCGGCASCQMTSAQGHPDVHHWALEEGDKSFKVERVRALQGALSRKPLLGRRQVHLLEDWDAVNASGANALLKALEEPPEGATLILRAASLEGVLPTITSRCQVVPFTPAPAMAIAQHLEAQGASPEQAQRLAASAEGLLGRAVAWWAEGGTGPAPVAPPWPPAGPLEAIAWAEAQAQASTEAQGLALGALLGALHLEALAEPHPGPALEARWALARQLEQGRLDLAQAAQPRLVWERLGRQLRQAGRVQAGA